MAKTIEATGKYKRKSTGEEVNYDFAYQAFDSLQDAIDSLGEDKALRDLQRMTKVDANNVAREKAKVANGDSERKVMTEEEKAEAKAKRELKKKALQDPDVLALLREKGINI
jgi:hypothetical protein